MEANRHLYVPSLLKGNFSSITDASPFYFITVIIRFFEKNIAFFQKTVTSQFQISYIKDMELEVTYSSLSREIFNIQ